MQHSTDHPDAHVTFCSSTSLVSQRIICNPKPLFMEHRLVWCRAQRLCVEELGELSPTNFNFPKFFKMAAFETSIPEMGSAGATTTAFCERPHGDLGAAAHHTNRRSDEATIDQARRDCLLHILAAVSHVPAAVSQPVHLPSSTACALLRKEALPNSLETRHQIRQLLSCADGATRGARRGRRRRCPRPG